jgi:FHA domain
MACKLVAGFMRARAIIGLAGAVAVCLAAGAAAGWAQFGGGVNSGLWRGIDPMPYVAVTQAFAGQAWATSHVWAAENYAKTPALMIGLAIVLLLPPLALSSALVARLVLPRTVKPAGWIDGRRLSVARGEPEAAPPKTNAANADPHASMAWPREAWLTVPVNPATGQLPIRQTMPRELLSIGRGEDNDLVLDDASVHRYHAVIQRTPEALFLIKDLGGPEGNGVRVNDERVTDAHLLDGDRIVLGATTLLFCARRVGDGMG